MQIKQDIISRKCWKRKREKSTREIDEKNSQETMEEMKRQRKKKARQEARLNKKTNKDNFSEDKETRERQGSQQEKMQVEQPPKEKVPPTIVLRRKGKWGHLQAELTRKEVAWTKARNELEGVRLHPLTVTDYRNIIRCFTHYKCQYHTYT